MTGEIKHPEEVSPSLEPTFDVDEGAKDVLSEALGLLKGRLSLFVWEGFFSTLRPVALEPGLLKISAESPFHRNWVIDHYLMELKSAVAEVLEEPVEVEVVHDPSQHKRDDKKEALQERAPTFSEKKKPSTASVLQFDGKRSQPTLEQAGLNPGYTFDDFVPGPVNQMAYAACQAVAEEPGSQYSPLFLFGASGLGKTHLLHAVGNMAKVKNPKARVVYMSAEQWVNAYVRAIRERTFDAFRNRFRQGIDFLLIDDIQFLAGKEASQDTFFHMFNSLYESHRQIILTADKYPHQIEGLEERLKTRLSWGLVADIRMPDVETRIAILTKKAERRGVHLSEGVAEYLSTHITTSVRELEGALLRLSAFSSLMGHDLSLSQVKEHLRPIFRKSGERLSFDRVMEVVASYYDVNKDQLKGKSRQRQITLARQVAMTFCREHLDKSLPEIGRAFGGRDHTTVLASVRKVAGLRATSPGMRTSWRRLQEILLEG